MTIRKRLLVRLIASQVGLSDRKTAQVVQAFLDQVIQTLVTEGRLELRDFGIFDVIAQKPRKLKHPLTGKPVYVPSKNVVGFTASKHMKKQLNQKDF